MKEKIGLLFSFILVMCLNSCKVEKPDDGPVPLEIEIDGTKIGEIYTDKDFGIQFCPPIMWEVYKPESSSRVESTREINKSITKKYLFEPKYVFFNYDNNSILNIGEVTRIDSSDEVNIKEYIKILTAKYPEESFTKIHYLKGNLALFHVMYRMENLESHKYIFRNKFLRIIQFDYTIRTANKEKELPGIMSSLGTLHLVE